MRNLFLISFITISFNLFGQEDHLERTKDFDRYSGIIKEYYDGLFSKLLNGLSEKPLARYLVIPSTVTEYVFSLQKENKEYVLNERNNGID